MWEAWNPFAGINKIMHLNAGVKKATSAMSAELYDSNSIFATVKNQTSREEYSALTTSLWEGCFFMPSVVPAY